MDIEPKIENPVCIRFGDTENVILADEINKQSTPLVPGVMFVGNHYGFVLITDINGKQKTKKSRIETYINDSIIPVSKTDIADALVDISVTTIEKVLSDLIKENKIEKIGTYKNARYIKANNIS